MVKALSRHKGKRFNIGALLRACKVPQVEGDTLVLAFSHRSHLERMQEELDDPQGSRVIDEAVVRWYGSPHKLRLALVSDNGAGGALAPSQSPLVRAALNMGARITEERQP